MPSENVCAHVTAGAIPKLTRKCVCSCGREYWTHLNAIIAAATPIPDASADREVLCLIPLTNTSVWGVHTYGTSNITLSDVNTYPCPEYPWAWMISVSLKLSQNLYLRFFPDVWLFCAHAPWHKQPA